MNNHSHNRGIFIGTVNSDELWLKEPLSVNLTGPPGSGKSSCDYIPTLLVSSANTTEENPEAIRDLAKQQHKGSFVIEDDPNEAGVIDEK